MMEIKHSHDTHMTQTTQTHTRAQHPTFSRSIGSGGRKRSDQITAKEKIARTRTNAAQTLRKRRAGGGFLPFFVSFPLPLSLPPCHPHVCETDGRQMHSTQTDTEAG
uniref:Uncharacterized protein n=1 Tax=Vitrella brassicaformis TaxID=1169539 RepID=A0A7S1P6J4_9ALVE